MWNRLAADSIVVLHLLFVLFVVFGGLLTLRWPRIARFHIPAAVWGVLIEIAGWECPLTPLEVHLRSAAGAAGYEDGFVEHYIISLLYPHELTRGTQIGLGAGVLAVNAAVYVLVSRARRTHD